MALSLNYPSPFGGDAFTYFIVGEVNENRYYSHAQVTLYGFMDAVARQSGAQHMPVLVSIPTDQWIKDATIAQIYALVKATPTFAAATDV
jgi:hypothetical protein